MVATAAVMVATAAVMVAATAVMVTTAAGMVAATAVMVATATVSKVLMVDCGSGGGGGSQVEVVVAVATAAVVVLVHSGVYLVVVEVAQLLQQFGRAAAAGLCMRYLDTAATILVFLLVNVYQFRMC